MNAVCWLLLTQGVVGAFDTIYFHEWRARLPAHVPDTSPELRLHALRDFVYTAIFGTLPWIAWHGALALALALMLISEIVITMSDFVVEARVRKKLGDVFPGERVTHAVMGIVFGVLLAHLVPVLLSWWSEPTAFVRADATESSLLRWTLSVMAMGVFLSGVRDLCAARGFQRRRPTVGD